jgi:hypothetical protein
VPAHKVQGASREDDAGVANDVGDEEEDVVVVYPWLRVGDNDGPGTEERLEGALFGRAVVGAGWHCWRRLRGSNFGRRRSPDFLFSRSRGVAYLCVPCAPKSGETEAAL